MLSSFKTMWGWVKIKLENLTYSNYFCGIFLLCVHKLIATNMTAEYIVSQSISCTSTDDLRCGTPQINNDISTLETLSR